MTGPFKTGTLVASMVERPAGTSGVLNTCTITAGRVMSTLAVLSHLANDGPFELGSPRAVEVETHFSKVLAGLLSITRALERLGGR